MLTMERFVAAEKYQRDLLTTCDRECTPEKSWNLTKPGLVTAPSCQFCTCWAYLIDPLTKKRLELC
jgi:hypothetical protein